MTESFPDAENTPREDRSLPAPGERPGSIEVEVKFRSDAADLSQLMRSPLLGSSASPKAKSLRSIYFDTRGRDLLKHGVALRIRKTGRSRPVMCVKFDEPQGGTPFKRREIEVRSPGLQPDISLFDDETKAELSRILEGRPVEAQFETQINRRVTNVATEKVTVEAAIDEGVIAFPDGRQKPVREMELELKSGEPADLYDLANRFAAELPLTLDFVSKSEKGFALLDSAIFAPRKAEPLTLDRHASLDTVVESVISNTLGQFVSNWAALREADDPESVHQLRVSLRRMRSALKMFRRILPCQDFDEVGEEAKRIASALGPARELDIFIEGAQDGPLAYAARPQGCTELMSAAETARAEAYRTARALIDNRQTTLFVLKLHSLVARHAWRNRLASNDLSRLAIPAPKIAAGLLGWLDGRVLKRGRRLMERSDAERHKLRIALKDLRYGIEFFSGLFGHGKRSRSLLKSVSLLQDLLGSHNDTVSTEKLVHRLAEGLGVEAVRAAGYMTGWHARGIPIADAELERVWRDFKSQRRFWH